MNYSDDAFVTLLLTMSLSPNREEFARPLSTAEMHQLEERVRKCDIGRIGRLANIARELLGGYAQCDGRLQTACVLRYSR